MWSYMWIIPTRCLYCTLWLEAMRIKPWTWTLWLYYQCINSLWPSDAIWRHRSGSTLAQVMACCLTAPSHYLNQCWLNISVALWHSAENIFTINVEDIYPWCQFENYLFKTSTTSSRVQWVNSSLLVLHTCINELGHHWLRYWLVACLASSHSYQSHPKEQTPMKNYWYQPFLIGEIALQVIIYNFATISIGVDELKLIGIVDGGVHLW